MFVLTISKAPLTACCSAATITIGGTSEMIHFFAGWDYKLKGGRSRILGAGYEITVNFVFGRRSFGHGGQCFYCLGGSTRRSGYMFLLKDVSGYEFLAVDFACKLDESSFSQELRKRSSFLLLVPKTFEVANPVIHLLLLQP
jgi:hypothetical protein